MAVPKKRTGHSAQGSRRSNWKATKPETVKCPNCGETKLAHAVCTACGFYKGKPASLKAKEATAPVEAKKVSKKAEVQEEVKEVVATEDVKETKKTTKKSTVKKATTKKTTSTTKKTAAKKVEE